MTLTTDDLSLVRQELAELKFAIENAMAGVSRLDANGCYTRVHAAYARIVGYEPEELLGKSWTLTVPESDQPRVLAAAQEMRETGRSEAVVRGRRKDDTTFDKHLLLIRPEGDDDASTGHYCFMRDVTELKAQERRLAKEQYLVETMIKGGDLAFWDWDLTDGSATVSDSYYTLLGYAPDAWRASYEEWLRHVHPDDVGSADEKMQRLLCDVDRLFDAEFRMLDADGEWRWMMGRGYITARTDNGRPARITGTLQDIHRLKTHEQAVKTALAEKEVLLRELYHRTKNNMQVICSMLYTQSQFMPSADHRKPLRDIENRIRAMALVHEKLYRSGDLSRINLAEYIRDLVALLLRAYGGECRKVACEFELDEGVRVLIDTALPCGLLLTELIANALKHAFPEPAGGTLTVGLARGHAEHEKDEEVQEIEMWVRDDGVGLPTGFSCRDAQSMGLQTVFAVAEHQLQGSVTFRSEGGCECRIRFAPDLYDMRV